MRTINLTFYFKRWVWDNWWCQWFEIFLNVLHCASEEEGYLSTHEKKLTVWWKRMRSQTAPCYLGRDPQRCPQGCNWYRTKGLCFQKWWPNGVRCSSQHSQSDCLPHGFMRKRNENFENRRMKPWDSVVYGPAASALPGLAGNADSQVPLRTFWIRNTWRGPAICMLLFNMFSGDSGALLGLRATGLKKIFF